MTELTNTAIQIPNYLSNIFYFSLSAIIIIVTLTIVIKCCCLIIQTVNYARRHPSRGLFHNLLENWFEIYDDNDDDNDDDWDDWDDDDEEDDEN